VGALDILANIAGIGHVGTLLNTTSADLGQLYAVNVRGIIQRCKASRPPCSNAKPAASSTLASIGGKWRSGEIGLYTTNLPLLV